MAFEYPHPGFHFLVLFELFPQFPNDIRFQEVSGLAVSTKFQPWTEGGENRFTHQLPVGLQFNDVVLKRGRLPGSGILNWARQAVEHFEFKPTNLMISLLNETHLPIYNWYVVNAVPKRLEISGINAMTNEVVVETLTLTYQYFKYYDTTNPAVGLSANVSIG
ncbi:phage tail protein [Candidatus Entotheonella palauensis]|uniref:Glycerol acyltransferase n=1 Tax=Candidatus Entotheonella gemina TaxID=1429439 RepID=W4M315_9BACT|nr:phage tail protein [Candidatus Entotheonella palauensis]ETX04321.1 MAG: glycerol acyltransferase [Candidatus Entotheonella gemina]